MTAQCFNQCRADLRIRKVGKRGMGQDRMTNDRGNRCAGNG